MKSVIITLFLATSLLGQAPEAGGNGGGTPALPGSQRVSPQTNVWSSPLFHLCKFNSIARDYL